MGVGLSDILRMTRAVRTGEGWIAHCPVHDDQKKSLSIKLGERGDGKQNVLIFCHVCGVETFPRFKEKGLWPILPPTTSEARIAAAQTPQADIHPERVWLPRGVGSPPTPSTPAGFMQGTTWTYKDLDGEIIGSVTRYDSLEEPALGKKRHKIFLPTFYFRRTVTKDNATRDEDVWLNYGPSGADQSYPVRPLYGLWKLKANANATILLVEGEKVADTAASIFPHLVTLSPMGGLQGFVKTDLTPLIDRKVIIWPDHDDKWQNNVAIWEQRLTKCATVAHVQLPSSLPRSWDLADTAPPTIDLQAILDSAVPSTTKAARMLLSIVDAKDLLKHFYAVKVNDGLPQFVFEPTNSFIGSEYFDLLFGEKTRVLGATRASRWFVNHPDSNDRQCVGGSMSVPGGQRTVLSRNGELCYNLYKPTKVVPLQGNIDPLRRHLDWLLNEEDAHELLCRLANLVQQPHRRPKSMYLLIGPQRIGKTMLFDMMRPIVGYDNWVAIEPQDLISAYNSSFGIKLMVVCNELIETHSQRFYDRIKALISDDTFMLREKYRKEISVDNYLHFFGTTNHNTPVTLPGDTEGRFYMAKCIPALPMDVSYYEEFFAWSTTASSALLYFLQHFDMGSWLPEARPNMTVAKEAAIMNSIPPHKREYLTLLGGCITPLDKDLFEISDLSQKLFSVGALKTREDRQTLRKLVEETGGKVLVSKRVVAGREVHNEVCAIRNISQYAETSPEQLWKLTTGQERQM